MRDKRKSARGLCLFLLLSVLSAGCGAQDAAYVFVPSGGTADTAGVSGETADETAVEDTDSVPHGDGAADGDDALAKGLCVYVYVCGAVASPGVVELPAGSRADDALRAAGGFLEEAATASVNLAAPVSDGEMLYIPTRSEAEELRSEESARESGLVNINTADSRLLCTLPGIGETRAGDIIAYREANGAFQSVEELMKVPGIKAGTYEKISGLITVK